MFKKLLEALLENWRVLAICAAALLAAGFSFYFWAYERGKASCTVGQANANLEATTTQAQANQKALGKEMKAEAKRVKTHTEIKRTIDDAKFKDADDPAPDLDQLFYERLRAELPGKTD